MKEKQYVYVKKDVKERDKEVIGKSVVFILLFLSLLGIFYFYSIIETITFSNNFFLDGLIKGLLTIIWVSGIFLGFYVLSDILTKKYKLKELKK
jgi:hypothetical protein